MAARRRHFRRQRVSADRPTWGMNIINGELVSPNTFAALIIASPVDWQASAGFRRATLLRIIGELWILPLQNTSAQAAVHYWALTKVNEGESLVNPRAITSYDEENIITQGTVVSAYGAGWASDPMSTHITFDTKTKRVMDSNSLIGFTLNVEPTPELTAQDVRIYGKIRTLIRGT